MQNIFIIFYKKFAKIDINKKGINIEKNNFKYVDIFKYHFC